MWKPGHYPSISPYLICQDAEKLLAFLNEAFGGVVLRRFDRPDGSLMHAEVRIDDSVVMVGGGATDMPSAAPHIHLYVQDTSATFRRAVAAGAEVVQEPQQKREDDDFRAGVRDFTGATWWIATAH
jgi:PhnB protein